MSIYEIEKETIALIINLKSKHQICDTKLSYILSVFNTYVRKIAIFDGDELEIANPLGDVSGIYKLALYYFSIHNFTRRHNSMLKNIFLIAACFFEDLKEYGQNIVVSKIVNEIKELETFGVKILNETYRGSILQFCGDNLGIHQLFGFKCCFRGEGICIICNANTEKIQQCFVANQFIKHSKDEYSNLVENNVLKECLLNEAKYFHVLENYAFDSTHDLWEGVVPFELGLIIEALINDDTLGISLDFINSRICSFNYGPREAK